MFEKKYQEGINILPIQVREFLKNHPQGSIRKFEEMVWENPKAKDEDIYEYSMLICYTMSQNYESGVNQVIQYLLQKIFQDI